MREVYLPAHNARFAKPAAVSEKAFVAANGEVLRETLCSEEQRVVGRDNTVSYEGLTLQLPQSRVRAHYVKARVKVREYPTATWPSSTDRVGSLARATRSAPRRRSAWLRARRRQGVAWKQRAWPHQRCDGQP